MVSIKCQNILVNISHFYSAAWEVFVSTNARWAYNFTGITCTCSQTGYLNTGLDNTHTPKGFLNTPQLVREVWETLQ